MRSGLCNDRRSARPGRVDGIVGGWGLGLVRGGAAGRDEESPWARRRRRGLAFAGCFSFNFLMSVNDTRPEPPRIDRSQSIDRSRMIRSKTDQSSTRDAVGLDQFGRPRCFLPRLRRPRIRSKDTTHIRTRVVRRHCFFSFHLMLLLPLPLLLLLLVIDLIHSKQIQSMLLLGVAHTHTHKNPQPTSKQSPPACLLSLARSPRPRAAGRAYLPTITQMTYKLRASQTSPTIVPLSLPPHIIPSRTLRTAFPPPPHQPHLLFAKPHYSAPY